MSARFLHERGHVANHQVKLKKKEEIAEGTMAFSFEKPDGFKFKPGQFAYQEYATCGRSISERREILCPRMRFGASF